MPLAATDRAITQLTGGLPAPDPTLTLPLAAPSSDEGSASAARDHDAPGRRPKWSNRWRIAVAAALLGVGALVAMPPAPRGAAIADLDSIGRHPDFRWPVERAEAAPADWPAEVGALTPLDR
jgi:hypothetical protein